MKMIRHQAITVGMCNRGNIESVFLGEEGIIPITCKNLLIAVSAVINMIKGIRFQRNHVVRRFNLMHYPFQRIKTKDRIIFFLQDQHRIAIGKELVLVLDGFFVCLHDQVVAAKSAHHDE